MEENLSQVSQAPQISPQPEIQIRPPKSWPKIILIVILGLIFAGGLVYTGVQIGKKQPQISVSPTPMPTGVLNPTTERIDCQTDSDCVLVIGKKECCSCPTPVNKSELARDKNLKIYHPGEIRETPEECNKNIACSPCPWWTKAVCESGLCRGAADLSQTPSSLVSTPTTDPTAGWKTYTYPSKTGESYAVEYPSSWATLEAGGVEGVSVEFRSDNSIGSVSIFRSNKYNKEPIGQWLIDKKIISSLAEVQEISVSGVVGKKLIQHKEGFGDVYLPYGQYLFIFTNQLNLANQSIFDQILSTFRFD